MLQYTVSRRHGISPRDCITDSFLSTLCTLHKRHISTPYIAFHLLLRIRRIFFSFKRCLQSVSKAEKEKKYPKQKPIIHLYNALKRVVVQNSM